MVQPGKNLTSNKDVNFKDLPDETLKNWLGIKFGRPSQITHHENLRMLEKYMEHVKTVLGKTSNAYQR